MKTLKVSWAQIFRGAPWKKIIGFFPLHLCHMQIKDGEVERDVYYIELTKGQHDALLKVPSGKRLKRGVVWSLSDKDTRHSGAEE